MRPDPSASEGHAGPVLEPVARPAPARYFPPANGRYEIKTGFSNLRTDFGNGAADGQVFQIDRQFPRYRREKLASRSERLSKYVITDRPGDGVLNAVAELMLRRLAVEHPEHFRLTEHARGWRLVCALTGETLNFDRDLELTGAEGAEMPDPAYRSTWDALACQVQEDMAVVEQTPAGDRISALHLCLPNHWAAENRIGDDFTAVHRPVAGFDRIARQHQALVRAMIERGPFVRFAWGLATDARLNHHPNPPPEIDREEWEGRRFDPHQPALYLRVERQTLWGLPHRRSCLFTIRAYLTDCRDLTPARLGQLRAALATMPADSLIYKGLARDRDAILAWLTELSS